MATTTARTSTKPRLITADELLQHVSDWPRGELIRGVFCEMPSPGIEHGRIIARLVAYIFNFVEPARLGTVLTGDPGIWVEKDPDTVRAPDAAFYSAERMAINARIPGYAEIVPDIVIEVVSPTDRVTEVNDKAQMWLGAGVRLVWVVWPNWQTVEVHRPGESVVELSGDAALEGLDILPGFSAPISDIFGE